MIVKPNILMPADLKNLVVDFALTKGLKYFRKNTSGEHRRLCNLNQFPDLPITLQVREFSKSCYAIFDIPVIDEPVFGNFIGVGSETSFVHQHMDSSFQNLNHVRLNFLLSKPYAGGMPVVNGIEYHMDEGQCWFNFANLFRHGSTPVQGDKNRIVLSLGCLVHDNDLGKLGIDRAI